MVVGHKSELHVQSCTVIHCGMVKNLCVECSVLIVDLRGSKSCAHSKDYDYVDASSPLSDVFNSVCLTQFMQLVGVFYQTD